MILLQTTDWHIFFTLADNNIRIVVISSIILSVISAVVGCFCVWRKQALAGDVVAHGMLPGICITFWITGQKNPIILLIGSLISGYLSLSVVQWLSKYRLKSDTATALSISLSFGIGVFLLSIIQKNGNAGQSGLDRFLFGQAAALLAEDLYTFSILGILIISTIFIFYKEFVLFAFDPNYAYVIGRPVKIMEQLLVTMIVLAVIAGVQAVGVVLMAALLLIPVTAARYWVMSARAQIMLAALLAAISGYIGAFVSFIAPAMPTGPWIVLILSMFALISIMLRYTRK
jgi:manganese/zinc/iron transport system permease protein